MERQIKIGEKLDGLYWVINIRIEDHEAHEGQLTTQLVPFRGTYKRVSITAEGYTSVSRREQGWDCHVAGCNHDLSGTPQVDRIMELARRWHLNDCTAGTPEQDKAVEEGLNGRRYDYGLACDILREKGLYEVTGPHGVKYSYGHKWLLDVVPEEVIEELKSL